MMIGKRAFVFSILICLLAITEAAVAGGIAGVVKNQEGAPVAGALVRVSNTERGLSVTVVSQDRGHYQVADLRSEERRVGKECRL